MLLLRSLLSLSLAVAGSLAFAQSGIPSIAGVQPADRAASGPLSVEQQMGFSRGFMNSMKDQIQNLKAAKRLPVRGLIILETKDGKTFLVSEDGRLAIIGGRWVDLWEKKQISSVDDAASLDRINFQKLGINPDEITTLKLGNGPRHIVVFADPVDKGTKGLVSQMSGLFSQFTFKVILVPSKAPESKLAISKLACSPDRASASSAFLAGSYQSLPAPTPACDYTTVHRGISTAVAIRIPGLPLVVRDDGLTTFGPSISLASSLKSDAR